METFVDALAAFEKTYSWWSEKTFMNLSNDVVRVFIAGKIVTNETIQRIATDGTEEIFRELIEAVSIAAPKMLIAFMAGFLNELNRMESLGLPISHRLVQWYRKNHWKFPPFKHEKIDSGGLLMDSTQPQTQPQTQPKD
jgi:hypothetical protein